MRYDVQDVPDDLPVGKHPSKVGDWFRDPETGEMVLPILYAPERRVSDSLLPIVKHADDCTTPNGCRCGWVHHDGNGEPAPTPKVHGMCTACGSVEVELVKATGTRDLSSIGESDSYPTGDGCEVCS